MTIREQKIRWRLIPGDEAEGACGGLEGAVYVWGDEFEPDGEVLANTWQGDFPNENLLADGYEWTAPVGSSNP